MNKKTFTSLLIDFFQKKASISDLENVALSDDERAMLDNLKQNNETT